MTKLKLNRRALLISYFMGSVTIPFLPEVQAATNPRLNPADPVAQTVGYVEDAAKVDVRKYATYAKGQTCANCSLVQMRYGPMRPCSLFPGKMVTAKGWCNAWVKRTFDK